MSRLYEIFHFILFSVQDSIDPDSVNQAIYDSIVASLPERMESGEAATGSGSIATTISIVVLVGIFGSFFLYNFVNNQYWEKGEFPPFMRGTNENKYEAVLNICVNIFLSNREQYGLKQRMLQQFLYKEFPGVEGDMSYSIKSAISQRVNVRSAASWLFRKASAGERERYFKLFFDSSAVDGLISQREERYLRLIAQEFHLDAAKIDSMIEDNRRKFAEKAQQESQRQQQRAQASQPQGSSRERHARTLGVPAAAGLPEIKKAYRKLVMQHHPDRFQNASQSIRDEAHRKFMEIQEAYEYFMDFQMA
jgi:DnaJ-domain-containing protein 1